jgi:hypothetical protein
VRDAHAQVQAQGGQLPGPEIQLSSVVNQIELLCEVPKPRGEGQCEMPMSRSTGTRRMAAAGA